MQGDGGDPHRSDRLVVRMRGGPGNAADGVRSRSG